MEHTTNKENDAYADSEITEELDRKKGGDGFIITIGVSRKRMEFNPTVQQSDRDGGNDGNTRRKDSDCVIL